LAMRRFQPLRYQLHHRRNGGFGRCGTFVFPDNRTSAIAQLFALSVLGWLMLIAASRVPAITAATVFLAVGLLFFSRNRTAVISKLFALALLAELVAIAVVRLPVFDLMRYVDHHERNNPVFYRAAVWSIGATAANST